MKRSVLFFLTTSFILVIASCKDNSIETQPVANLDSNLKYVGEWKGTTNENLPVKFKIIEYENHAYITNYNFTVITNIFNGDTSYVGIGYSVVPPNPDAVKLNDGKFIFETSNNFLGVFVSDSTCSGSFNYKPGLKGAYTFHTTKINK